MRDHTQLGASPDLEFGNFLTCLKGRVDWRQGVFDPIQRITGVVTPLPITGIFRLTQPWLSLLKSESETFDTLGEDLCLRSH